MIYLDNSATTLIKPPQVAQAVYDAINTMGNSGRGAYNSSISSSMVLYETRELIAKMFNLSSPEQVAFTLNATEALNTAINGLILPNDHIITTELEHNSVLRPLYRLEEKGTELTIINANNAGNIDYTDVENAIKANTKAIVCTHCSNLTGNVIDISKIGEICRRHDILFILDASQSAGIFDIDMEKQNIDVVCFTGHKSLYGPQGTGGICIKKVLILPLLKSEVVVLKPLKRLPLIQCLNILKLEQ